MKRAMTCMMAFVLSACGELKSNDSSNLTESPVRYDITCSQPGGYYWVGINRGGSYAYLQLDWGRERDIAYLSRINGYHYNFSGLGQYRAGYQQRHFQVAFSQGYRSVTVYFDENGFWIQKAVMNCREHR
jgi:hypothetical protein